MLFSRPSNIDWDFMLLLVLMLFVCMLLLILYSIGLLRWNEAMFMYSFGSCRLESWKELNFIELKVLNFAVNC